MAQRPLLRQKSLAICALFGRGLLVITIAKLLAPINPVHTCNHRPISRRWGWVFHCFLKSWPYAFAILAYQYGYQ